MQFREVGAMIQVLLSVYDSTSKRTRQKMVMSFHRYRQPEKVTVDQLENVPDEKRQECVDEINAWLAEQAVKAKSFSEKYSANRANQALMALVMALQEAPEAIPEADLAALAETLRTASKLVANRSRSIKMKANAQSDKRAD